jgi:hypothetical protein
LAAQINKLIAIFFGVIINANKANGPQFCGPFALLDELSLSEKQ